MRYAALLLLAACGPASFEGTFTGTLDSDLACDTGGGTFFTATSRWKILQASSAGKYTVYPSGLFECGAVQAMARSGYAELSSKTCPTITFPTGGSVIPTIKSGGTITFTSADKLKVALTIFDDFRGNTADGGIAGSNCNETISGTLTKQ